jgi:hypothetical protein
MAKAACIFVFPAILATAASAAETKPRGPNPVTEKLADIFIRACIDGELRLPAGTAKRVDRTAVGWIARPERHEKQGQFFKLDDPGDASLSVMEYERPTDEGWIKICEVRSRGFDLKTAWMRISAAVNGGNPGDLVDEAQLYHIDVPALGFYLKIHSTFMFAALYDEAAATKLVARHGPKARVGARRLTAGDLL